MARKFVKATGLHNIFNAVSDTSLDLTSIKQSVQPKVNETTIVFLTASDDASYGYPDDSKYIWTMNTLYPTNDITYSASDNIDITNNTIKAIGYRYDTSNGAFAEGDRDIDIGGITIVQSTATGIMAHAEGGYTVASGMGAHAEGGYTTASGIAAHAEGAYTVADSSCAHAEGGYTIASGECAHAEGAYTTASNFQAHAEGFQTIASGAQAHAEGEYTTASGPASHTEGYNNTALNFAAHAEGIGTQAQNAAEHAEGIYNISHTNSTIHSIGIGASNNRKNAVEVIQNGDMYIYGIGNYDGTDINEIDSSVKPIQQSLVQSDVVLKLWSGTENEYDNILVKDPSTLYIIKEV